MSERYDMDVVRSVLARLEADHAQELAMPDKRVTLRETIPIWGTRGFEAGCAVGIVLSLAIAASSCDVEPVKVLIAIPLAIGVLAALGATIGMLIGTVIWCSTRRMRMHNQHDGKVLS
jgi:hypothetical protein